MKSNRQTERTNGKRIVASQAVMKKIGDDLFSVRINDGEIHPLLLPEQVGTPDRPAVALEVLDVRSRNIISRIEQRIADLARINPLKEGGYGYDHPALKISGQSETISFPPGSVR